MSTHLLSVGKSDDTYIKYRQINIKNGIIQNDNIYSALSCERNRILYIGITLSNRLMRVVKVNLMTSELEHIADINWTSNTYIGGMVVDDDYLYFGSHNSYTIHRLNLSSLDMDTFITTNYQNSGYGKLGWFDEDNIMMVTANGIRLFHVKKQIFTMLPSDASLGTLGTFSSSTNTILMHRSTSIATVNVYHRDTNLYETLTLPDSSAISISCYGENGVFYIARSNYLYFYDELENSITKTISIPWTNPKTINYTNGVLYVTQNNSNVLYIYDVKKDVFKTIILPWTIPNKSENYITEPSVFRGCYFLPHITMGMINYSGNVKYNLGHVVNKHTFLFTQDTSEEYEYDDRFITFTETFVTIHDGVISFQPQVVDSEKGIKKISVEKSSYKKINSITFDVSNTNETD